MTRPRLSVVVVTLNEEERLRACLESVAWADELIVVDAESQDKSVQIAREFTDRVTMDGPHDGYRAPRRNIFWGRWIRHGGLWPDWQLRLFKRGRAWFAERAVHESVAVTGSVGRLEAPLVHRSYRDVSDFLARADRYSTLAAEEWVRSGTRVRASDLLLRPAFRFLSMYVLKGGCLDGRRGFLLATLYAYYVFIRSAKAWELREKDRH